MGHGTKLAFDYRYCFGPHLERGSCRVGPHLGGAVIVVLLLGWSAIPAQTAGQLTGPPKGQWEAVPSHGTTAPRWGRDGGPPKPKRSPVNGNGCAGQGFGWSAIPAALDPLQKIDWPTKGAMGSRPIPCVPGRGLGGPPSLPLWTPCKRALKMLT